MRTSRCSARVPEDVLKIEGFSHKIVQVKFISWVKQHKQCAMILALLLFLFRFPFSLSFFFFVSLFSFFSSSFLESFSYFYFSLFFWKRGG